MSRRRFKPVKFVSFLRLSDDIDELLELLGQAESLNLQAENEMKLRRSERELIKAKLKKLRGASEELQVSDHAIVRYLERVVGIDIAALKSEMIAKIPESFVSGSEVDFIDVPERDLRFVIRENLIISITPKEMT